MLLYSALQVHSGSLCGVNKLMCPLTSSCYHSPDTKLHILLCGVEGLPELKAPVPEVEVSVSL